MRVRGGVAALIAGLVLPLSTSPAVSEDLPAITNTLPEFVSGAVDFEIKVSGINVCQMTYGGVERSTAPWKFTFDPVVRSSQVRILTCDQATFNYYIHPLPDLAYALSRAQGIREAGFISKFFVINNVDKPAKVQVSDPNGKVLMRSAIADRSSRLAVILPKITPRFAYLDVSIASDDGAYLVKDRIPVSRGWATVTLPTPISPCSTIAWRYQSAGAPHGTSRAKIDADIKRALSIISTASGLTFVNVSDQNQFLGSRHSITFAWRGILGGDGAQPQSSVTRDPQGSRVRAQIWLNALDANLTDRYAGAAAGKKGALPGRVWPIVKGMLRLLSLEQTSERGNLLYPGLTGPAGLGDGDHFALRYLYNPSGCELKN